MSSEPRIVEEFRAQRTQFTTTHWSLVLAARRSDSAEAQTASDQLCHAYWYPFYAYVHRRGNPPDEAEDLSMVKVAMHRLRRRHGELLRAEIVKMVQDPNEV